jgi:hypothetical protein
VKGLRFDSADRQGVRFSLDDNGLVVSVGEEGFVRAARGFEDGGPANNRRRWPRRIAVGRLPSSAAQAAAILHDTMLVIRSAGSLHNLGATPTYELARTFAGAGSAILTAGTSLRREAAFQRLIEQWRSTGGDLLAELLDGSTSALSNPKLPQPVGPVDPQSQLLVADYSTRFLSQFLGSTEPDTSATLVLADPDRRSLRRVHVKQPAEFVVQVDAFGTSFATAQQNGLLAIG